MGCVGLNFKSNIGLDERVNEIRYCLLQEEYEEVIEQGMRLFKDLKSTDKIFYFWFCMFDVALAYIYLNNVDKAFAFVQKAMEYNVEYDQRIKTKWLLANCYVAKHMYELFEKSEEIYKECLRYYKKTNIKKSRIELLYTLAEMKDSVPTMIRLILIMIADENHTPTGKIQEDLDSYDVALSECKDLAIYCNLHNKNFYLWKLLNKITNKNLKKRIRNLFTDMKCM